MSQLLLPRHQVNLFANTIASLLRYIRSDAVVSHAPKAKSGQTVGPHQDDLGRLNEHHAQ